MQRITHYQQNTTNDRGIANWCNNDINTSLYYSYRSTYYTAKTFPSQLHYHDYFELIIFESGEINYICEKAVYQPRPSDVLLIPPGSFHMSAIRGENTLYSRHVFYLYSDALDIYGGGALTDFLKNARENLLVISLKESARKELLELVRKLYQTLKNSQNPANKALSVGLLLQIFFILNGGDWSESCRLVALPQNLSDIKEYIDLHFAEITGTNEVAERFFYSREYVSRLFRKHFNTTVSEYIKARRIAHSQHLLERGYAVGYVCYQCGFENMSTYIRSFRSITDMTPSQYRKIHGQKNL